MRNLWNGLVVAAYVMLRASAALAQSAVHDSENSPHYSSATEITVAGDPIPATRAVSADCSVAGAATFTMAGGGTYPAPLTASYQILPLAVLGIVSSTATCTYYGLY